MIFRKTVDDIVASFARTIADLEDVRERSMKDLQWKTDSAERLLVEARQADAEAARAAGIAARLRQLIG